MPDHKQRQRLAVPWMVDAAGRLPRNTIAANLPRRSSVRLRCGQSASSGRCMAPMFFAGGT